MIASSSVFTGEQLGEGGDVTVIGVMRGLGAGGVTGIPVMDEDRVNLLSSRRARHPDMLPRAASA